MTLPLRPVRLLAAFLLLPLACAAATLRPPPSRPVKLCVEENFPPFEYAAQGAGPGLHGATVEFVTGILKRNRIPFQLQKFPWTRCLAYVKQGAIDIGLDTYYDQARNRDLVYSEPYYALTPQYYYSKSAFPNGLRIRTAQDLKRFHGCGILGFSYAHYGLSAEDIDTGVPDHTMLVRKLKAGRCDYFVEELEVMRGYTLTGHPYLADRNLGHAAVPGARAPELHLIMHRGSEMTPWLMPLLNRAIAQSGAREGMRTRVEIILQRSEGR